MPCRCARRPAGPGCPARPPGTAGPAGSAGRPPAHLLQLQPGRHLLGDQRRLDAVEQPLQPADQLGLRDPQLGLARRCVALANGSESRSSSSRSSGASPSSSSTIDRWWISRSRLPAGLVERGRPHLLQQLLDHAADPHHLGRLLDQARRVLALRRRRRPSVDGAHRPAVRADHHDRAGLIGLRLALLRVVLHTSILPHRRRSCRPGPCRTGPLVSGSGRSRAGASRRTPPRPRLASSVRGEQLQPVERQVRQAADVVAVGVERVLEETQRGRRVRRDPPPPLQRGGHQLRGGHHRVDQSPGQRGGARRSGRAGTTSAGPASRRSPGPGTPSRSRRRTSRPAARTGRTGACSAATVRSQSTCSTCPPPMATPLTAAMTGFGMSRMIRCRRSISNVPHWVSP